MEDSAAVCAAKSGLRDLLTQPWSRGSSIFSPLTGCAMSWAVKTIFLGGNVLHLPKGVEKIALTVRKSGRWNVDCYHNCCNQVK